MKTFSGISIAVLLLLGGNPQFTIPQRTGATVSAASCLPFTDSFTRANAANLGTNYTQTSSGTLLQILSNAASTPVFSGSGSTVALLTATGCTPTANQSTAVTLTWPGGTSGGGSAYLLLRATDVNNYDSISIGPSGSPSLNTVSSGSSTYVGSFTGDSPAGHTLKATVIGTTYTLCDVTTSTSLGSVTASVHSSGYAGIGSNLNVASPVAMTNLAVASATSATCP